MVGWRIATKPTQGVSEALWESLRLHQWTKNLFIFAGLLFSKNLFQPPLFLRSVIAFVIFVFLSGAIYLLNDLVDLEQDRRHPVKIRRPLASGRISVSQAWATALVLLLFFLTLAFRLGAGFFWTAASYVLLQGFYQLFLKRAVILDAFSIAGGFALRVIAGAMVIGVEVSSWLIICTSFLSLFIALGKRRQELVGSPEPLPKSRQVLEEYSPQLLDQMISIVAAATVILYALYTMSEETLARFGTRGLIFTIPFVLYGILRYLYLIHRKGAGEEPEMVLASDRPLMVSGFLWAITTALVIYG